MPRRPSTISDVPNDRPWIKRQKQILVSLAVFAGCAVLVSHSSAAKMEFQKAFVSLPNLRQGRIRRRPSPQQSKPQATQAPKNHSMFSSSFASAFDVVQLPVNTMATMYDDVTSIEHLPAFSRIDIHLKDGARCPRPYVMGRLSGPALEMIQDWKWSPIKSIRDNTNTTILTGHYQLPESGNYHLEIIVIHCHDFLHNMKMKNQAGGSQNGTEAWEKDIDETLCMEDPWKHRLTAEGATLAVDHSVGAFVQHSNHGADLGYWRNQEWLRHKRHHEEQPWPLFTRFQFANGFFWGESGGEEDARVAFQHDRHQSAVEIALNSSRDELENHKICLVGSRQSHHQQHLLRQRISEALGHSNITSSNPVLSWGHVESPYHVTPDFAKSLVQQHNCRKLVLMSVAPFSTRPGYELTPMKVGDYYRSTSSMIRNFVALREHLPTDHPLEVYVVSLRYHALHTATTSCPPRDWRSPPLIDGYNAALSKACDDHGGTSNNVTFLNTRPLVNPTWDFSDKSNPTGRSNGQGLAAESLHVARTVLGIVGPRSEAKGARAELEIFSNK